MGFKWEFKKQNTLPEGTGTVIRVLNTVVGPIDVFVTGVHLVQVELLQNPPCQEKTSAVSSSVVGQTNLNSIPGVKLTD